jgi:archaellum component FlaC
MLAAISRVDVAVAKQLAKKYVKTIEDKLGTTAINGSTPELINTIKGELDDLEREINEVNNNYSQISYI